jgi:hypothetical protein
MTRAILVALCSGLLATTGAAAGFTREMDEYPAIRESLEHVSRKQWAWWLERHGYDASRYTTYQRPVTTGLRLVGKYGRGPSVEVMAQDTLMALTLGSECALLNIANPDDPQVLSEIQLDYLPNQSLLSGSLLLTGGNGIQIWDIANPSQPVRLSEIPYAIGDFSIVDTFLYFVGNDTFFAYSFANPASPRRIGFCRDSGYVTTATQSTAVLIQPNDVLGFVDVSDPAHPHQVGIWPAWPFAATARGNLCCAAFADPAQQERSWFLTLDISNPANPRQIARLDSVCGSDILLSETLAFVSGRDDAYEEFRIVNVADSTQPRKMGTCYVWNDNWGVWADLRHNRAYIASEPSGLAIVDITNLNAPHVDTCVMTADQAEDIWIDGDRAYISDYRAGFRILDVSDPTRPAELGGFDSLHMPIDAAVALDSFAFVSWWATPYFRTFDVSDPSHPVAAGGGLVETTPEDMVLRDTFIFLAGRLRFNVVNVAKPRQPVLVGSCVTSTYSGYELVVADSFAYVAGLPLLVVSLAQPDSPFVAGEFDRGVWGLDVVDTILYAVGQNAQFWTLSVANPAAPRVLDSLHLPSYDGEDVAVVGTKAYVSEMAIRVLDVSNPGDLRMIGQASVPQWTPRLVYAAPYLYACCAEGGVCVFETLPTGIEERTGTGQRNGLTILPSVTDGRLVIRGQLLRESPKLAVFDVSGKEVMRATMPAQRDGESGRWLVDLSRLSAGVYVLRLRGKGVTEIGKVIITRR